MCISDKFKPKKISPLNKKLQRARHVLAGANDSGEKCFPSMFDKGVLSFSHGEGMRRPAPEVIAAGLEALIDTKEGKLENYKFLEHYAPLKNKIIDDFKNMGIASEYAENFCEASGSSRLFCGFLNVVTSPGDIFLTGQNFYHTMVSWCDLYGADLEIVETSEHEDYKLTRSALLKWFKENSDKIDRVKGIFLINPSMTGAVLTYQELHELSDFMVENDLIAIQDAVFAHTTFDGHLPTALASIPEAAERTFTINSPSKCCGLANIRYGWGCGPKPLIDEINRYIIATSTTVPHVAKSMTNKALEVLEDYKKVDNKECVDRVSLLTRLIDQLNSKICSALYLQNHYAFIKIAHRPVASHSVLIDMNFFKGCITETGQIINDSIDLTRLALENAFISFSPGLSVGFDDCKLKLSYGCVGADKTYRYQELDERISCLELLTEQNNVHAYTNLDVVDGFKEARALIEDAFTERLIPALEKLVDKNQDYLRTKVSGYFPQTEQKVA